MTPTSQDTPTQPGVVEDRDTTLIVRGSVRVIEGKAYVFGCPVVEVSRRSFFPLYIEDGKVEVVGDYIPVKGSTIPESWVELSERLDEFSRIFLIGEVDSGKSSLAAWLLNSYAGEVCVIDADIGQADIAHPGAMGIGVAESVPFLSEVEMLDGFFTGTISPMGRESKCIRGFSSLCRKARELGKPTVVDTTGWVKGRKAREYKLAKIEAFSPDAIVFVGMSEDAISVYSENLENAGCEILFVDSFVPKKRDRESRLEIRNSLYKNWFEGAEEFEVRPPALRGTTLFRGKRIEDGELLDVLSVFGEIVFAEKGSYFLNVCVRGADISQEALKVVKEIFEVEEVTVFEEEWMNGLLCGIYDGGRYICPGLVREVDFEGRVLRIEARNIPEMSRIELGEYRIVNGREEFVRVP